MMKRVFAGVLLSTLFVSTHMNAGSYYESMQTRLKLFGQKIENVDNVPLIDQLTNLLPFGMLATCLKECPGQTMLVLTGLLVYVLCANDKFRSVLRKYNPLSIAKRSVAHQSQFDDSLFVFEGDDEDDAQEQEDDIEEQEDNDEDVLTDEYSDEYSGDSYRKNFNHSVIKFI